MSRDNDKISKCYYVQYEDFSSEYIYTIKGLVQDENGNWLKNGKPMEGVAHVRRCEWGDRRVRASLPQNLRKQVYAMFGGRCAYCGKQLAQKQMRVDHVIPVDREGGDEIENLRPACFDCNQIKSNGSVEGLRESVSHFMDTIKKDIRYRMLVSYGLIQETPHDVKFLYEESQ